ncbi:multicopper oxidase domain-containing protein [Brachybacterium equifaecis]
MPRPDARPTPAAAGSAEASAAAPPPVRPSRRSWHRRASRPVTLWMMALIVVVLIHPLIPQSRWLLVHMVTLGLVTTSIMVWGQHFAEALLKTRLGEETRARQVRRIQLLTAGIVVTCTGMVGSWPWIASAGALLVSAAMLWYALALGAQIRVALAPRFAFVVRAYQGAACLLPVGALIGTVLAFSPPEPWLGRLLLAHQLINVLGFVGLTITATLLTLWPTVLRTRADAGVARRAPGALLGMGIGAVGAAAFALTGFTVGGIAFLLCYLACFLVIAGGLVSAAVRSARGSHRTPLPLFPVLSIGAGACWFAVTLGALAVMWRRSSDAHLSATLLAADLQALTLPLVVGFALQVLLGAMSHLLPVTMGGGPRATAAGLREMSRLAVLRVVALNLALALFVLMDLGGAIAPALFSALSLGTADAASAGSLTRVLLSSFGFAVLLAFVVLLLRAVRASVRERRAAMAASGASASTPVGGPEAPEHPPAPPAPTDLGMPVRPVEEVGPRSGAVGRRGLTSALVGIGSVLGVTALGGSLDRSYGSFGDPATSTTGPGSRVAATGRTTTVAVSMAEMRFTPDVIEVPAGDALVIELKNEDPHDVHDLVLATGPASGRLQPGSSERVDAGVIGHDVAGWCSIVGHRAMGMRLQVIAIGGAAAPAAPAAAVAADPLARVLADLQQAPAADAPPRDASLPASTVASAEGQRLRLEVTEAVAEIAPGVRMHAMTYNGRVVGPVIRSEIGQRLTVDLINSGSMGHSLDLHAGRIAPDGPMRTIAPGESLEYAITTEYAGVWLYHCSTMPMTVHLASGMLGAVIVPPQGIAVADREFVLVQSDHYLVPIGAEDFDTAMTGHEGHEAMEPGAAPAHPVSPAKIAAERPDFTVFNGHANQYVHAPLQARVGERVRIWVLAAGPSRGISFHVVGAVFDTVFREGEYLLRPDSATGGGSQVLHLGPAQGGFVETVFDEPGTYTAVNHAFADMERGARALISVTG